MERPGAACVPAGGRGAGARRYQCVSPRHELSLTTTRKPGGKTDRSRYVIAAEGLAAVGRMIPAYRRSDGAATDFKIAWVTVTLRILRAINDVCVPMDPAHRRLWTDVVGNVVRGRSLGKWRRPHPCSPWRGVVNVR